MSRKKEKRRMKHRRNKRKKLNPRRSYSFVASERRGTAFWTMAEQITQHLVAVSHQHLLDSLAVEPVVLVKLGIQGVCGMIFFTRFQVKGENGLTTMYTAAVWVKPAHTGIELMSFDKVIQSRKREEVLVPLLPYQKGRSPDLDSSISDDTSDDKTELSVKKIPRQLHLRGYHMLLEEIKDLKPGLKFNEARRAASSKWKGLYEHEKASYMEDAIERLNEKRPPDDLLTMRPIVCHCYQCREPIPLSLSLR